MDYFLNHILPPLLIVITVVAPIIYVSLTGNFLKGVVLSWLLIMIFCLIVFFVYPAIYIYQHGDSSDAKDFKPVLLSMLIMGWVPALIFSTIGLGIRFVIYDIVSLFFKMKPQKSTVNNEVES